jgi:hypothetical protein
MHHHTELRILPTFELGKNRGVTLGVIGLVLKLVARDLRCDREQQAKDPSKTHQLSRSHGIFPARKTERLVKARLPILHGVTAAGTSSSAIRPSAPGRDRFAQ